MPIIAAPPRCCCCCCCCCYCCCCYCCCLPWPFWLRHTISPLQCRPVLCHSLAWLNFTSCPGCSAPPLLLSHRTHCNTRHPPVLHHTDCTMIQAVPGDAIDVTLVYQHSRGILFRHPRLHCVSAIHHVRQVGCGEWVYSFVRVCVQYVCPRDGVKRVACCSSGMLHPLLRPALLTVMLTLPCLHPARLTAMLTLPCLRPARLTAMPTLPCLRPARLTASPVPVPPTQARKRTLICIAFPSVIGLLVLFIALAASNAVSQLLPKNGRQRYQSRSMSATATQSQP